MRRRHPSLSKSSADWREQQGRAVGRRHRSIRVLASLAAAGCIALAGAPLAQGADEVRQPTTEGTLEEVLVTAQRREQSLQDVSIAITAIGSEDLERRFITSVDDLAQFVPGMEVTGSQIGSKTYRIRGVGAAAENVTQDYSVGVFIDDIYASRAAVISLPLLEVERVEVLRGPQGTLYGKNTAAGAIRYVSKKPNDEFATKVTIDAGEKGLLNGRVFVNGALTDTLAGQLSLVSMNQDALMDNHSGTPTGKDGNDTDLQGARVALRGTPADSFEWLLAADVVKIDQAATLYSVGPGEPFFLRDSFPPVPASDPVRSSIAGDTGWEKLDAYSVLARGDWTSDSLTTSLILGYRSHELDSNYDDDQLPERLVQEQTNETVDFMSAELHFAASQSGGLSFGGRMFWDAGLFASRESSEGDKGFDITGVGLGFAHWRPDVENISYGVYGQGSYSLTQRWRMTAGVRYSYDKKEVDIDVFSDPADSAGDFNPLVHENFSAASADDWQELTYKLALEYDLSDEVLAYLSFTNGYKAGGFEGAPADFGQWERGHYDPEYVDAYELGLKSMLFEDRLRLNLAAYYSDYVDMQTTTNDGESNIIVVNAGSSEITGLELEMQAAIGDSFDVNLGFAYTHAEFKDFLQPQPVGPPLQRSGDRFQIPEKTWSVGLVYRLPEMSWGTIAFGTDYFHADDSPSLIGAPSPQAYDVVNARIDFLSLSDTWQASVWAKNLGDELYWLGVSPDDGFLTLINNAYARKLEPPRLMGVSFTYRWR
jgi:iron complex outermembrane receptor protein